MREGKDHAGAGGGKKKGVKLTSKKKKPFSFIKEFKPG